MTFICEKAELAGVPTQTYLEGMMHSFDFHYRQESGIICFILWLLYHKTASNGSKLPVMIIPLIFIIDKNLE